MTRTWAAALAVLAFGAAFLAASAALGGEAEPAASTETAHVRLSSVAALPTLAKDPAVELARARREARRERLRAAARRAAAPPELPAAPAPVETPTTTVPEAVAPPAPPPVAVPTPTPTPAPAPAPTPPPETFDDSG
jgi:hypothetical protein